MPTFAYPETATILSQTVTGQDGDGNDIKTPVEITTSGAFAPEGSTELIQGQETVIANPTFYLEVGAPTPAATDQLIVRGETYNIDGKPGVYHNPFTGFEPGAVLRLERVTG